MRKRDSYNYRPLRHKKLKDYRLKYAAEQLDEAREVLTNEVVIKRRYLDPELSARDIGKENGLTPALISAACAVYFHLPFRNWVNGYRVEYAQTLLLAIEPIPVKEVWRKSGFGNHQSFYAAFCRKMGMTPMEYVRQFTE